MHAMHTMSKRIVLLFGLALACSAIGVAAMSHEAQAWCNNVSLAGAGNGYDNACVAENYDSLPDSVKRDVSIEDYRTLAEDCMNGNASMFDFGIREGGCADAAATCLTKSINRSYCTGDNMASIVSEECNDGKLSDDVDRRCLRLQEMNEQAIEDTEEAARQKAMDTCSIPTTGSEVEKTRAREACARAIDESGCTLAVRENGTTANDSDYANYQKCLNDALQTSSKTEQECTSRNEQGKWIPDAQDPTKGRCALYSDFTNREECEANGGEFQLIDNKGNTNPSDDHYECAKPGTNPNGEEEEDPTAEGVDERVAMTKGRCGQARVNLLACGNGTEEGAEVFNRILRIVLTVLSIIIGIAAVGGMTYAALTYARAEDDQSKVGEAKTLIRNIVIGILLYGFLIAIALWLLPGLTIQ